MAEAVGLAAGIVGLVSAAQLLGACTLKLKAPQKQFRDAPARLEQLVRQLTLLEHYLKHLQPCYPREITTVNTTVDIATAMCRTALEDLNAIIDVLESTFQKSHTRGKLQVMVKKGNIDTLPDTLERDITNLMFATNLYHEQVLPNVTSRLEADVRQVAPSRQSHCTSPGS
jgi:hypothetical protein